MVLSELIVSLRREGIEAKGHQVHYGIRAGYIDRPAVDGSGNFRFEQADVKACRQYLQNIPKPGRKAAAK